MSVTPATSPAAGLSATAASPTSTPQPAGEGQGESFNRVLQGESAAPAASATSEANVPPAQTATAAGSSEAATAPAGPPAATPAAKAPANSRALPATVHPEADSAERLAPTATSANPAGLPGVDLAAEPATADRTTDATASAAPEAFLQWLDQLKALTPPPTPPTAPPSVSLAAALPAASEPALGGGALAPGALSSTAISQQMIDALASPADTSATAAPASSSTPLLAATATAPAVVSAPQSTPTPLPQSLPLAMDQPDWPQQLGEQIQWRLGVGIQEARIEINPRELGAVDVRLSVDDSGLRVQLNAAQAQTRELLQAELPRLREALQQGGLQLADAQVGREAPGRQHQPSPHQQHGDTTQSEPAEALSPTAAVWRTRRGLLDDYA